jgi:hypothetical protein
MRGVINFLKKECIMGDRAQVLIKDTGIYLYTHWDGYKLENIVKKAISKKLRWNDPEYLSRIIFDEMIGENQYGEVGYGIGTTQHGDVYNLIEINCKDQTFMNYNGSMKSFDEFITSKSTGQANCACP